MPNSMLFAINNEGRVFGLSTIGSNWREFPYLGLDFKSLSAVPHFLWAVGGDRQVYVHVHGLDIPIRVKEETYENQRWFPLDGFSKRLLPTDRHQFSTEDGLTKRNKGDIRVPSMAWQWESDWHIETTLGGQQLDHDGWTYAMDFPGTYYSSKQWSSCVRRRKWVRNRKYVAMNSWCAIAPLHKDPTQEPFIDVSVGGQCMTGGPLGALQVWAVTAHGRVMWRKGVSMTCPEGTRWNAIPIPNGCEVKQISCGATGLVWSVLWSGKALVRIGINAGNTIGDSWEVINAPEAGLKLSHVSVGTNAVWALTSNGRVWFRKGIDGNATANKNQAKGTGWVEMVGTMAMVSVAPSDQVFAVGRDDRTLYMRVGVTSSELTGKRWRCLQAGVQVSRTSSVSSLNHYRQHRSTISLNHSTGSSDRCDWLETSRSAPTSLQLQPVWQKPVQSSSLPASEGSVEEPILENVMSEEVLTHRKVTAWSPVRSVGSLIGLEANPDTDPHADWDRTVFPEREIICEPGWSQADTLWSSVEAGAIQFDPAQLPNWFIEIAPNSGLETAPWRTKILEDLSRSHESLTKGFEKYELAVEMTSCIKSVECRCCLMGNPTQQYEDCLLELEWTGSRTASVEIGTLSVLSLEKAVYKYQVSLSEIVCVVSCSEPGCPRIAVHTIDSTKNNIEPLRIHFSGDIDHDDWMASLSSVCCQMHNLEEAPGPNSIWATTKLGDVYAFDPVRLKVIAFFFCLSPPMSIIG
ncbi:hypothetical protein AAG570_000476 [Ranatra chinensis]|uniref:Peroxin/Ferlin domain-containing protein n=1 Tax=Ranatra chinensis TaxID=642074 RepID=A0ABD0YX60_9HEMI